MPIKENTKVREWHLLFLMERPITKTKKNLACKDIKDKNFPFTIQLDSPKSMPALSISSESRRDDPCCVSERSVT